METATQKVAGNGRPPRPRAPKPSTAAWSTIYSPHTIRASPRAAKLAHQDADNRPKRPLSASRVTSSSQMANTLPRPNSARPARPTSVSKARYLQLETIVFPMQNSAKQTWDICETCMDPPFATAEADALQETDSAALQMKLEALLEMWTEEQHNFRSPALFCETTFKQAKALASKMPHPNGFLSAVSFACLLQVSSAFIDQYPFLTNVISELGSAIYSNFTELQHQVELDEETKHQSAFFFEHGKPWFQELSAQKLRFQTFQTTAKTCENEVILLTEMLQEARAANSMATTITVKTPSRSDNFDEYYIPPVLQLGDLSLKSLSEEILNAFTTRSDADARHILALLLENAVEREIPKLPDLLAENIGQMKEQSRRTFLRECFDYVTPSELQDVLQERDEINDDKRYHILVDDLHNLLRLQPQEERNGAKHNPSDSVTLFHSEEARIGKKVHELIDLLEDVAAEVCLLKPNHQNLFPDLLLTQLRAYEDPVKRLKKEYELMNRDLDNDLTNPQFECVCGRQRLIKEDEERALQVHSIPEIHVKNEENDSKKQKSRRRSTLNRPSSAPLNRRKNAICFNTRLGSSRKSSASNHVFPLTEVCHLVSAILHLQFSRDAAESSQFSGSGAVSILTFDARFSFLRKDAASRTFKTLAKDYLVRKYGIKSIAVMYTLQLERSLLHYAEKDKNVRCELFGWFSGADKARSQSKDFAFAFFQKLVKCILHLFAVKKASRSNSITSNLQLISPQSQPLAYSALISLWIEYVGDGEPPNSRLIPVNLALEACKQVFPRAMQRNNHFILFKDKLYRQSLEKTIEMEEFFREVMTTWQFVFDLQMEKASKSLETAGVLDLNGFTQCLVTNKLEFTTGERLELFDLLTQESDENFISSKKMVNFIMKAKYLTAILS